MKLSLQIFFSILFSVPAILFSQEKRSVMLYGKVSDKDGKPISFVNIIKTYNNIGCITDTSGVFSLTAQTGDLIKISSIGYMEILYRIPDTIQEYNFKVDFTLKRRYYLLDDVDIFSVRWEVFKEEFLDVELPEEKIKEQNERWIREVLTEEFLAGLGALNPGLKFNIPNKKDRKRKEIAELEKKLRKRRKANKRMKYLSGRFTRLKGLELEAFVNYCNFSVDFLTDKSDYEITVRIKRYYLDYRKKEKYKK